ncbi:MAG: hypothetical protein IMX02_08520 [Limnochordaceae bacterium]|nr:hypothetical protein [Limnochordaceae bacterium]
MDERAPASWSDELAASGWEAVASALAARERSDPDQVRRALEDLVRAGSVEAARAIQAYRERSGVKRLRQLAGQSLGVLAARGVRLQTEGPGRAERVSPESHALVSLYDGRGLRVVVLAVHPPGRGMALLWAALDDGGALAWTRLEEGATKKEFLRLHEAPEHRPFERLRAVPLEYGRFLVHRGAERTGALPSAEARKAAADVASFVPPPARRFERPILWEQAPGVLEQARERLDELLAYEALEQLPEIWTWVPGGQVGPEVALVRAVEEGRLALAAGAGWVEQVARRGAGRLYGEPPARERYAERFFELAYALWIAQRKHDALAAAAAGLALEDPDRSPGDVRLLRMLVEAAIAGELDRARAQEGRRGVAEEPGRPAGREARRRVKPGPEARSPSMLWTPFSPAGQAAPEDEDDEESSPASGGSDASGIPLSPAWERRGRIIVPRGG